MTGRLVGNMKATSNFDPQWGARVAQFCAEAYAEHVRTPPASIDQAGYAMAADVALDCGQVIYALGAAPEDVRAWIARAAHALGEVFRLRGSVPTVPSVVITKEGAVQATTPATVDLSLTNAGRGVLAMYTALVAGDRDLAERIASVAGDPPDGSLAGPGMQIPTDEQQLDEALRALLLGQDADADLHARHLAAAPPLLSAQAAAIQSLVAGDQKAFLGALCRLLAAHAEEASDECNAREPRLLASLPGLGLSALAVSSGLLERDQLPQENFYLPLEIIPPAL